MVRDAAAAPGIFLHGDLGASCAAALAVRSSGAARGPVLSAADRAACWRRDVLLSGIFGHHAVAAALDLDVPAAEALGLLPHFATLLLFRSGVHFFLPPARAFQPPPAPPACASMSTHVARCEGRDEAKGDDGVAPFQTRRAAA